MASCPPQRQRQLEKLVQRLGLPANAPIRWDLLDLALTHPSVSGQDNYEQLEFVGDAVVRLFAAVLLQAENTQGSVGEWSAIRSVLVSDRTLATLASTYGLDRFLLLGPSTRNDRRGQDSRLADAFEAVLGALYLSTNDLSLIQPWLQSPFRQEADQVRSDPAYQNYKAALQQWTQAVYQQLPEYRVRENPAAGLASDPGLNQRFTAEVWLQEQLLGVGNGHSIKAAEKAAAHEAFLKVHPPESETEF